MENEQKDMVCSKNTCAGGGCGCGHHHMHIMKWLVKIAVLVIVFCFAFQMGELKGALQARGGYESGHSMMYRNSPRMMDWSNQSYGTDDQGSQIPTSPAPAATSTK